MNSNGRVVPDGSTDVDPSGIGGSEVDARTRLIVIQPQQLVRQGMVRMLESTDDLRVVAHTGDATDAVRLARDFQPDVVVVDIDQAGVGSDLIRELKSALDGGRVLVMAERATQTLVERILGDGADGYTLKGITVSEFIETVRKVASGELTLHPAATGVLARSFAALANGEGGGPVLTRRQREIVELLVAGMQNKQIARRLGIGVETVKTHVSRIIERLGVSSRTEVVVVAIRDGLVA